MRRIILIFSAAALTITLSGCYRFRYQIGQPSPRGTVYVDQRWNNYFIFGFAPVEEEYQMKELCRAGEIKEVQSYRSPGNVLATIVSAGLSASSTVEVSCLQK